MYILYIIAALLAAILITMLGAWQFVGDTAGVLIVVGLIGVAVSMIGLASGIFFGLSERAWQALNYFLGKIPLKTFRARELKRKINKMHQLRYSYGDEKQQQELAELEQALKVIESGK
jgi:hypothetical protein